MCLSGISATKLACQVWPLNIKVRTTLDYYDVCELQVNLAFLNEDAVLLRVVFDCVSECLSATTL